MAENGISPSSNVNVVVEAKNNKTGPVASIAKNNGAVITLGGPQDGGANSGK